MCAALAAVGVGVGLAIEHAVDDGPAAHAAAVLGIAVAAYLVALSAIQRAAPRGLATSALVGRAAVAAIALVVAGLGHDLSALALVAVAAEIAGVIRDEGEARHDAA